jgi:hypothetical protein
VLVRSIFRTARDGQTGQFHQWIVIRGKSVVNHPIRTIAEETGNRDATPPGNFSQDAMLMLFQVDLDRFLSNTHLLSPYIHYFVIMHTVNSDMLLRQVDG